VMGGYTLGGADILRRAMGKKKHEEMEKQKATFIEGAAEREVDEKTASDVFDLMAKFAGYGFNKSHAAAYSIVAYQTAWLKAHYTAEFMAAAMTNEMNDTKKLAIVLEEARHLGLELLPPDINASSARFTVENGKIRMGMGAVKGVGLGAIEAIVAEREKAGPFKSLFNFVSRVDLRAVNKKAVESLTRVGAMDCLEGHRAQLAEAVDVAIQYGQKSQANAAAGMISLFGEAGGDGAAGLEPSLPMAEPWPKSRLLKEERESVGFYVTGHPLEEYTAENRAFASAQIADAAAIVEREGPVDDSWAGRQNRPQHTFCGIITSVQHRMTKSGKPWASAQFEDFSGQAELVCFSNTYDRIQNYLSVDEIVLIKGPVELRGGSAKVMANDVIPMWKVREQLVKSLSIRISAAELQLSQVDELEKLLSEHRGGCKLYLDLVDEDRPQPTRLLCRSFVVDPNTEVMQGIGKIFGRRSIVVEGD